MHLDPTMPPLVAALLAILLLGLAARAAGQPPAVAYLLAGVAIGPGGLGLVRDEVMLGRLGNIGVALLLFFAGMEVSPRQLVRGWKVSLGGTLFQILVSVACVWALGAAFGWPVGRIVLIGFVISLSSTAVVISLLESGRELHTPVGRNVLGILLVQDVAVIPMLIVIGLLGGGDFDRGTLILQLVGGALVLGLLAWMFSRESIGLPLPDLLRRDHELQVFAALVICFGVALITGLFDLSAALGAFVAGMLVGAARETRWVHHSLSPFRVVFVALFFVSVGMLVDLRFIAERWPAVALLVALVLVTNTFINALILRLLGSPLRESLYAGALLSQIGEFSFVLAALGMQSGLLTRTGYQTALAVISLSLLVSPFWIRLFRPHDGHRRTGRQPEAAG